MPNKLTFSATIGAAVTSGLKPVKPAMIADRPGGA